MMVILSFLFVTKALALSLSPGYIAITNVLHTGESYEVTSFKLKSEEAWISDVTFLQTGAVSGQVLSFELEDAVLPPGGTAAALAKLSLPGGMPGGKWKAGFLALTIPRQFPANLALQGIVEFQVENPRGISRIEAVAMLAEKLKMTSWGQHPFLDSDAHDVRSRLIAGAFGKGLIKGYPDGRFRPDKLLSRAEAAVILQRALGLQESQMGASDVPADHWAASAISALLAVGHLQTSPGGEFVPDQPVGRNIWQQLVDFVSVKVLREETGGSEVPPSFDLPVSLKFNILQ